MTTSARVTAGTVPATELDEVPPPRGEDDGAPGPDGARPPRPAPALPRDADTDAEEQLALIRVLTKVSVIVPTYKERENLPFLVEALDEVRRRHGMDLELLVMDDDSRDGSEEWVAEHGPEWMRLFVRHGDRGLSPSVLDGLAAARHPVVVVMDADLSHPPQKIPQMILALQSGQQFVIGSRYVPGGTTDDEWGFFRWLNSRVATILARPFTRVKDPMAGFFALRRADYEGAEDLNPIGYKIGLELIVKGRLENVGEIPIHFTDRVRGESKLTLQEQLKYIRHLRRLYMWRYATWSSMAQFAAVGASGVVVNLGVLSMALALGAGRDLALVAGIVVSVVTNFLLNRRFTFSDARDDHIGKQFVGFSAASSVGALVQYGGAKAMVSAFPEVALQVAALVGIAAGMFFNFVANRYFVFKKK